MITEYLLKHIVVNVDSQTMACEVVEPMLLQNIELPKAINCNLITLKEVKVSKGKRRKKTASENQLVFDLFN